MPKLEQSPSRIHQRSISPAPTQSVPDDEELSNNAVRAIAEGRADHAAGRTFTMDEIKPELGIIKP